MYSPCYSVENGVRVIPTHQRNVRCAHTFWYHQKRFDIRESHTNRPTTHCVGVCLIKKLRAKFFAPHSLAKYTYLFNLCFFQHQYVKSEGTKIFCCV